MSIPSKSLAISASSWAFRTFVFAAALRPCSTAEDMVAVTSSADDASTYLAGKWASEWVSDVPQRQRQLIDWLIRIKPSISWIIYQVINTMAMKMIIIKYSYEPQPLNKSFSNFLRVRERSEPRRSRRIHVLYFQVLKKKKMSSKLSD